MDPNTKFVIRKGNGLDDMSSAAAEKVCLIVKYWKLGNMAKGLRASVASMVKDELIRSDDNFILNMCSEHKWVPLVKTMLANEESRWNAPLSEFPPELHDKLNEGSALGISFFIVDFLERRVVSLHIPGSPREDSLFDGPREDPDFPEFEIGIWNNTDAGNVAYSYSGTAVAVDYVCRQSTNGAEVLDTRALGKPHVFILDNGDVFPALEKGLRVFKPSSHGYIKSPVDCLTDLGEEQMKCAIDSHFLGKVSLTGTPIGWELCNLESVEKKERDLFPSDWKGETNYPIAGFLEKLGNELTDLVFDDLEVVGTIEVHSSYSLDGPGKAEMANSLREAGVYFFRRGDFLRANRKFQWAIAMSEDTDEVQLMSTLMNNVSICLWKLGDYETALHYAEKVLSADPLSLEPNCRAKAHYRACLCLSELGRVDEAVTHRAAARRLSPGSSEVRALLQDHGPAIQKMKQRQMTTAKAMLDTLGEDPILSSGLLASSS